jgi:hypothetical protein
LAPPGQLSAILPQVPAAISRGEQQTSFIKRFGGWQVLTLFVPHVPAAISRGEQHTPFII